ncbi:hypothetical protein CCAN2_1860030 [Capnocytophaga canimorsus]|nr:hypothetical protein CCAN2_1860030 [Capnocytophaga canimorsus]
MKTITTDILLHKNFSSLYEPHLKYKNTITTYHHCTFIPNQSSKTKNVV